MQALIDSCVVIYLKLAFKWLDNNIPSSVGNNFILLSNKLN